MNISQLKQKKAANRRWWNDNYGEFGTKKAKRLEYKRKYEKQYREANREMRSFQVTKCEYKKKYKSHYKRKLYQFISRNRYHPNFIDLV